MCFFCLFLSAIRVEGAWLVFIKRVSCHNQINALCVRW